MIQGNIIHVIVVEESANDAELILNSLRKARFPIRPTHVEDAEDFQAALSKQEWDLVISVPAVLDFTIVEVCELVKMSKQDIPVIGITDKLTPEVMAQILGAGAFAVIPANHDQILQYVVSHELENLELRREKRKIEHLYRETQRHNKTLLKTSRDAICYVHDGIHILANPAYMKMFGYTSLETIQEMPVMDLVAPEDHAKFKEFMREYMTDEKQEDRDIELIGLRVQQNSKRHKFKLKMELSQAIYDSERCIQIIIRDQSNAKELEQKIKEISRQDPLTGLYNRQHFVQLLDKALTRVMEGHQRSLVLFIALDNFVALRERVGIGALDPLITDVANILKEQSAQDTSCARFGENTFALLLHDKDSAYAQELAKTICEAVRDQVTELGEQSITTTCSIGIAQVLASAGKPQEVLSDAHQACQKVSQSGGDNFELYKAVIKEDKDTQLSDVAKMIETAIEEKRLFLAYQPIVSLRGESDEIYEVYLRMVDADGNQVSPGLLFSAAEQANFSAHLDKWVLRESMRVLRQRHQEGSYTRFFIKLSDQAVKDSSTLPYIQKLLKATQLPGDVLTVEISEALAINQIKIAKNFVAQLTKLGCKTGLEHFGTGLNPEHTLRHVDVNYVKIDSSYAKGLSANAEHQTAVKEIVELAQSFNRLTIAEAVEDANSLSILWQCEVDYAQGYYIQEPSPNLDYDFEEE